MVTVDIKPAPVADPAAPQPGDAARGEAKPAQLWFGTLLPVVISLFSLVLSIYTIFAANREPVIWLSAPDVVRLSMGERAWFYVQPRLVSAASNDRVGVVSGLRLEVTAPGEQDPAVFFWDEQGAWEYDHENRGLTWIYVADAAPLVVGPSSPQLPICLFEAPEGWVWQPGDYSATIVASRGEGQPDLRTEFAMTLSPEVAAAVTSRPRSLWEVRTTGS